MGEVVVCVWGVGGGVTQPAKQRWKTLGELVERAVEAMIFHMLLMEGQEEYQLC